jgi:hypothetical protein
MASAWLIRRFIDPNATFGFVDQPASAPPAGELRRGKPPSDIPFDTYAGEFSHQGPLCTYEVLTQRFGLTASPAVERIGRIVHDLDMHDTRYGCAETPAVGPHGGRACGSFTPTTTRCCSAVSRCSRRWLVGYLRNDAHRNRIRRRAPGSREHRAGAGRAG